MSGMSTTVIYHGMSLTVLYIPKQGQFIAYIQVKLTTKQS